MRHRSAVAFLALAIAPLLAAWGSRDREPEWPHTGPMPDDPVKVRPLRYESIGKVVYTCQRASILKIGFITEPPPNFVVGG